MLIKTADDKTHRLRLLQDLAHSQALDPWQKEQLRKDLDRLRKGIAGERDAAHYIDSHYRDSANHAVIHDLRIVLDDEVAQIDHLMVSRGLHFYLMETKNYNGNLTITDAGEFSVTYDGERTFGIPSPLEQSKRHAVILKKLLARLEITGRMGTEPSIHHVVLVDPKATIQRPAPKALDTSMVIKADQFRTWHERFVDRQLGVSELFTSVLNMRGSDTLKLLAEKIAGQHRPGDPLALGAHLQPRPAPGTAPARAVTAGAAPTAPMAPPPPRRATLPQAPPLSARPSTPVSAPLSRQPAPQAVGRAAPGPSAVSAPAPAGPVMAPVAPERKLVCADCGKRITFAEGKFCWNQAARFGGLQYCRDHQTGFSAAARHGAA